MMQTALRAFSFVFLTYHASLYFPGLLFPVVSCVLVAGAFFGGRACSGLRWNVMLPVAFGVFLGLRLVLVLLPGAFSVLFPAPAWWDAVPLWSERHLTMTALPMALAWWQGWWHRPERPRLGAERLMNAALLVAVFWAQGPYHVTLYPVPLGLGLALLVFLLSELSILLLRRPSDVRRRTWLTLSGSLAVVVLTASLLWSLFDTYEELATVSGGGLMKPDLFQFDFSSLVRLESQISLSDHLVLLYREPGPGTKRYLRRFVLSGYDPSKGFFVDPHPTGTESEIPPVGRRPIEFAQSTTAKDRVPVQQEYFLVNLDPSSLVALNAPTLVQPYARWDKSSFVNAYRVESEVASELYWELAEVEGDGLQTSERQHNLDYGQDEQLRTLALSLTQGRVTTYEKALAIQAWLKSQFLYSLKPGAPGPQGALKTFLFETRKGYCSYFAFSMALLLRSLEIPARVSVGFLTDPGEKVLDFYPVRAFQAHAWVEVPFGPYGWIDFDPTSETPAPGEDLQLPKAMDVQEMTRMISEILQAQPKVLEDSPTEASDSAPDALQSVRDWGGRWGLLALLGGLLAAQEVYRHRHRLATLGRSPRDKVEGLWRWLRWRAHQVGRGPLPAETPRQWAIHVAEARQWVEMLERARYAPEFSQAQAREAQNLVRPLFTSLTRRVPLWERALRTLLPWLPALRRGLR